MQFLNLVGGFLLFVIRMILLWVLIPFAFIAWGLVHWWAQKASVGQSICWYDSNYFMVMLVGPLRFMRVSNPELKNARILRFSEMREVEPYPIRLIGNIA